MSAMITMVHTVPGRVRIRCAHHLREAQALADGLAGVKHTRANPACRSLVVLFDAGQLTAAGILEALAGLAGTDSLIAKNPATCRDRQSLDHCACPARRIEEPSLRPHAVRFGVLSAAGLWMLGRKVLLSAAAPGLVSPVGAAVLFGALPLLKRMVQDFRRGKVSLESFLGGAIVAAAGAGEVATALEVLWINTGSDLLTAHMARRSRRSIKAMLKETAHHTFVLRDGVEVETPTAALQPGDILALHAGERIPADGLVISGEALVDSSSMTGRSELEACGVGVSVYAGSVVRRGVIHVEARCVGEETYLARIFDKVEAGLSHRSDIEHMADTLARRTITIGFLVTAGTLVFTQSLWRAFTVLLVMACPCATSLAASSAINAAIAGGARERIIFKGGRPLERFAGVDAVCLDKTGTLTGARPHLAAIHTMDGLDEHAVLQLALSAEAHNHHPLAEAIKDHGASLGLEPQGHERCEYFLGQGVHAVVDGKDVLVGNYKLLQRFDIPFPQGDLRVSAMQADGLTVLFLARQGAVQGLFGVANPMRRDAGLVVEYFRDNKVDVHLVTGDEALTAQALARELRIPNLLVSALPEDKARLMAELRQQGKRPAMVGDGVNDALAMVEAEVGVALGSHGNEAALEAADIALMGEDLEGVMRAHLLSQRTIRIIHENFWLATGSNILGGLAGALGLLGPVAAGLLHIGHTSAVLLNSARLMQVKKVHPVKKRKTPQPVTQFA